MYRKKEVKIVFGQNLNTKLFPFENIKSTYLVDNPIPLNTPNSSFKISA